MSPIHHVAPSRCFVFTILAGLLSAVSFLRGSEQEPLLRRSAADVNLKDLIKAEREAAKAKGENEISISFQSLSTLRSFVGDYAGAIAAQRQSEGNKATARRVIDPGQAKIALEGYRAVPAIDAIVEEASRRQIVILNEAHHISRHRFFAQVLGARLRAIEFDYLACETFAPDVAPMEKRGYVTRGDGYYTREPLFADFVRQSLKLGYIPIAYEDETDNPPGRSEADSINARETQQAANLMERIFRKNPKARVFIYVGYSHLLKGEQGRGAGQTVQWLAGRLKTATGIDPLTIDQVAMTDPEPGSLDAAVLEQVFSTEAWEGTTAVLRHTDGPGYLVRGSYAGDADMQVFHRATKNVRGRPDWMSGNGYRKPWEIPVTFLPKSGRRLIKAMVEGEDDSSIAMDQVIVKAGDPSPPVLMLPAGRFQFFYEQ